MFEELEAAIASGDIAGAEKIISQMTPAEINEAGQCSITNLYVAIKNGDYNSVQLSLAIKPELINLAIPNSPNISSILKVAILSKRYEIIKLLVCNGTGVGNDLNYYYSTDHNLNNNDSSSISILEILKVAIVTDYIFYGRALNRDLKALLSSDTDYSEVILNRLKSKWMNLTKAGENTLEQYEIYLNQYTDQQIPINLLIQITNPQETGLMNRLKNGLIKIQFIANQFAQYIDRNATNPETEEYPVITIEYYSTLKFFRTVSQQSLKNLIGADYREDLLFQINRSVKINYFALAGISKSYNWSLEGRPLPSEIIYMITAYLDDPLDYLKISGVENMGTAVTGSE